ncbi:hypothetical protein [Limimaricola sp.]|uniref:hypothetical protein n=1 Tax=Limimaricola sp. TaxID=2211665 RepID=UPI0040591F76
MARLIDCSIPKVIGCEISLTWGGKLRIKLPYGWKSHAYEHSDIAEVLPIDEEKYRSAGGAAVGAIVGGVLTGGIGFLAGAAIGGRRRRNGSFLIRFTDGQFVAFEEKKKANLIVLDRILESEKVRGMASPSNRQIEP